MKFTNHYVYLLSHRVEEKYYIGVRSCNSPIGEDNYKGSSCSMTQEEKDACNKIILKRFNTRKEAVAYEIELHDKFDVAANPLFWNNAKQTSCGWDTTGVKLSSECRKKMSLNNARAREVRCINTGEVFRTIQEAAIWSGTKHKSGIMAVCRNKYGHKTSGKHPVTGEKLKWEYVNKDIR